MNYIRFIIVNVETPFLTPLIIKVIENTVSMFGHLRRGWPDIEKHWVNVSCNYLLGGVTV